MPELCDGAKQPLVFLYIAIILPIHGYIIPSTCTLSYSWWKFSSAITGNCCDDMNIEVINVIAILVVASLNIAAFTICQKNFLSQVSNREC